MFQFPGFAFNGLCIQPENTLSARFTLPKQTKANLKVGCPIRKSADQSLFAAPHSLSQRITSFIASDRQGIHQTPFLRLIRSRRKRARHTLLPIAQSGGRAPKPRDVRPPTVSQSRLGLRVNSRPAGAARCAIRYSLFTM